MPVPPLEILPDPPPGGTAHTVDMGAEERSREGVMDRQGLEGEESRHPERKREKEGR